jgi:hypothetical protein
MSDIIGTDDPFSERDKAALQEILGYMIPLEMIGRQPMIL